MRILPEGLVSDGCPIRYKVRRMHRRVLTALASRTFVPRKARWMLLRLAGVDTAAWNIGPRCVISGTRLHVGRGTFINRECLFDTSAPIHIGARCAIGMRVMVITASHDTGPSDRRAGELSALPVTIGDGCWLGAGAMILPGVTIGEGCIIAAGAIVRVDCDADTLYAGVPAIAVRPLSGRELERADVRADADRPSDAVEVD